MVSRAAARLECAQRPYRVVLDDDQALRARSIVVATGARYRRLSVPGYERFEGAGIHYAATAIEQRLCRGEEVVVVGGGNSAGQAAVFLSRTVAHVHMLVRSGGLAESMSDYLVERIQSSDRITLHTRAEITGLEGERGVSQVTWTVRNGAGQTDTITRPVANVFVMIGAEPNTDWLRDCLALDAKGFVCTGPEAGGRSVFETSRPGVFAVGDVRAALVKRVASAVGEGSVVVASLHQDLATLESNPPQAAGTSGAPR